MRGSEDIPGALQGLEGELLERLRLHGLQNLHGGAGGASPWCRHYAGARFPSSDADGDEQNPSEAKDLRTQPGDTKQRHPLNIAQGASRSSLCRLLNRYPEDTRVILILYPERTRVKPK